MKFLAPLCFALALLVGSTADADGRNRWPKSKPTKGNPGPAIPEPGAALLFGAGLAATIAATRRREQR